MVKQSILNAFLDELGKIAQVAALSPTGAPPGGNPGPPPGMFPGRRSQRQVQGMFPGAPAQTRNPQAAISAGMTGGTR